MRINYNQRQKLKHLAAFALGCWILWYLFMQKEQQLFAFNFKRSKQTLHSSIKFLSKNENKVGTSNSNRFFSTALGKAYIEEINENVFEPNGYTLIKDDLIPVLKKTIPSTCDNVFLEWQEVGKAGLTKIPPKNLPNPNAFLLNNYTRLSHQYEKNVPENTKESVKVWSKMYVDVMVRMAKNNASDLHRPYGQESLAVNTAMKHFNISGLEGVVIGSLTPWAEAYALANDAKHVTTIDYQKYIIRHPQMDFLYALDLPSLSKKYYNKFDFAISFSSIEHSGLGRYGDPIDPIGDLREMNKIHCLLKPKGLLFLGFPVGIDSIVYNIHRVYGRIRLAMVFEGFQLHKIFKSESIVSEQDMEYVFNDYRHESQYLFVLEKK